MGTASCVADPLTALPVHRQLAQGQATRSPRGEIRENAGRLTQREEPGTWPFSSSNLGLCVSLSFKQRHLPCSQRASVSGKPSLRVLTAGGSAGLRQAAIKEWVVAPITLLPSRRCPRELISQDDLSQSTETQSIPGPKLSPRPFSFKNARSYFSQRSGVCVELPPAGTGTQGSWLSLDLSFLVTWGSQQRADAETGAKRPSCPPCPALPRPAQYKLRNAVCCPAMSLEL